MSQNVLDDFLRDVREVRSGRFTLAFKEETSSLRNLIRDLRSQISTNSFEKMSYQQAKDKCANPADPRLGKYEAALRRLCDRWNGDLKQHFVASLYAEKRTVLFGWIDTVPEVANHLRSSLRIGQGQTIDIRLANIENPHIATIAGRRCIEVPQQEDALSTADAILFESCNAENDSSYRDLDRAFGRDIAPSLSAYGLAKARIEARATLQYIKLVTAVREAGQPVSASGPTTRVLQHYEQVANNDDAFIHDVCNSPHKCDAADHQRLITRVLYEIEKVFVMSPAMIQSKLVIPLLKKWGYHPSDQSDWGLFLNWTRRTLNAVTNEHKPRAVLFISAEANARRPHGTSEYQLPFSADALEVLIGRRSGEFPGLVLNPLPDGYDAWVAHGAPP